MVQKSCSPAAQAKVDAGVTPRCVFAASPGTMASVAVGKVYMRMAQKSFVREQPQSEYTLAGVVSSISGLLGHPCSHVASSGFSSSVCNEAVFVVVFLVLVVILFLKDLPLSFAEFREEGIGVLRCVLYLCQAQDVG